ncbi:MAG: hypothetical protein WAZ98_02230 [Cyclobacteriaceae bacterium]
MSQKKIIVLFCALLLPVAIFLFLKSFGKNEFNVEPLYQKPIPTDARCAGYSYQFPYSIPDSLVSILFQGNKDTLALVILADTSTDIEKHLTNQLDRIFKESALTHIFLLHNGTQKITEVDSRVTSITTDQSNFQALKYCALLLSAEQSAVLIDDRGRIRGQYTLSELDEADRLIVEAKIMLKQY